MRDKYIFFTLTLFIFCSAFVFHTDKKKQHSNSVLTAIKGDLNKDALDDSAVVLKRLSDDSVFYELKIFFRLPQGGYKFIAGSKTAIEPHGFSTGDSLQSIAISKNVLIINYEELRGHYENKFRYQNGNFELIGHEAVYADGRGSIFSNDFNLVTGRNKFSKENMDDGKILRNRDTIIHIRPLPKLQDFVPYGGPILETGSLF